MKTEANGPIAPSVIKVKCDYGGNKVAEAMLPEFENKQLVGLTKREYFAAMALSGYRASCPDKSEDVIVMQCIYDADALIVALNTPAP